MALKLVRTADTLALVCSSDPDVHWDGERPLAPSWVPASSRTCGPGATVATVSGLSALQLAPLLRMFSEASAHEALVHMAKAGTRAVSGGTFDELPHPEALALGGVILALSRGDDPFATGGSQPSAG